MLPMGGTSANLPVDDEIIAAVSGATERGLRAVKVAVDGSPPRLVVKESVLAGDSFAADFADMNLDIVLEDGVPCVMLIRLADAGGTVPGTSENDWVLLSWTPDDAPVRVKMMYASSRKTLKDSFKKLNFKEMNATERGDVTLKELLGQTRQMTQAERYEAMSREEIDADRVRQEILQEQRAAPKRLAGLVALQVQTQASFDEALARLLAEEGKAVLARLSGPKREELSGQVLEDAARPPQLRGRLPLDEPCYVICRMADQRLLLLTWLPENSPARVKMTCSTFKRSVLQLLQEKAAGSTVVQAEVSEEDDLNDELGAARPQAAQEDGAAAAGAGAVKLGGFRPPPGAFGGFALPGLGPRP